MVKFSALQSAKVPDSKAPKPHDDALDEALEKRLLMVLIENPKIKQTDLVATLDSSRATVQRMMKTLTDNSKIERKGGKRYGYWEVHEE